MLILFMGPTASGKTTVLNKLCALNPEINPVVRLTTREKRPAEINMKDYKFISVKEFKSLIKSGELLEYEEYSGERFYGTLKKSLCTGSDEFLCSTITPSGLMQLCSSGQNFGKILLVYCFCSLATQIIRYVTRKDTFTISDKMEMCDRLARDEGMFKMIDSLFPVLKQSYINEFDVLKLDTEKDMEENISMLKEHIL